MLAFVMVFTGMGIGSWGVDEAWAEEDSFSKIAKINYTAYDKKGKKIIAAYSFTTDNEECTATCKTIESYRSLSKISKRITLIDEEEKTIEFDNMSITLNGTTTDTWAKGRNKLSPNIKKTNEIITTAQTAATWNPTNHATAVFLYRFFLWLIGVPVFFDFWRIRISQRNSSSDRFL